MSFPADNPVKVESPLVGPVIDAPPLAGHEQADGLEDLYGTAPIGLALMDRGFRFVRMNERLAAINGKPVSEHIGHTLREIIPQLAPEIEVVVDRVFASGEPVFNIETHGSAGGDPGNERDWLKSYYPVRSSDGALRFVGVVVLEITERKTIAERAERAASERRLNELANAMPQIVWTARPDGHVDYCNDRWYEYTGLSREGGGDQSWQAVLHPDDVQKCMETWYAAVRSGNSYEIEYRFREHTTERYRWHLGRALPVKDGAGTILRWIGTCTDINDQKRAEENLRTSEQQFHDMGDSIPQLAWMARADGHTFWHNKRFYDYTGTTPGQIEGSGWEMVHDPAMVGKVRERWAQSLATGEPFEMVLPLRGADGEFRTFLTRTVPLRSPEGSILQWFGTSTDITERVQQRTAELWKGREEFRRNEQRYRSLVEATASIVWNTPASGEFESEQPGWEAFTSQSFDQLKGWGWLDAVHPDDRRHTSEVWLAAVAGRTHYEVEHRLRRRDAEYRSMMVRAVPILDDRGLIREWIGVHTDVTDQKLAEGALAESERFARSTLDALSAHIAILDEKGCILATNRAWRDFALANSARSEVGVGANYLDVCDLATGPCANDAAAVASGIREVIRDEREDFALDYPCHSPSEKRWFLARATRFAGDGPIRVVMSHENVTAAKLANEEREKFVAMVENSTDFIGMATLSGEVIYTNRAACEMVGYDRAQSGTVTRIPDYYTEAGKRVMEETVMPSVTSTGRWEGEVQFQNFRTGLPIETDSSVFVVRHPQTGEPLCIATVTRDITERKLHEQELQEVRAQLAARVRELDALATIDGLTGIANRRTFQARLESECARSNRGGARLAVMLLDIDHFKTVNDNYGHPAGDEVLTMMGRVLASSSRNTDFVARFGGEEFVVLLIDTGEAAAKEAAQRLRTRIAAEPWPYLPITVSIGIASWGPGARSASELIARADRALYFSKEHGRNRATHWLDMVSGPHGGIHQSAS
jgi:diguanylate cyclase (GGDEF)-like protein/PAS domain S-box-containing protein